MGPCLVEVGHIRIEDVLELLLLKDQQMVEAFLSDTPQEALADGIDSGCMNRRFEYLDCTSGRHAGKARPVFVIVITNQILGCLSIRGRFSQLLPDPRIGWRACYAHVDYLARLQFDHEESKEWSKKEICYLQEVARQICAV